MNLIIIVWAQTETHTHCEIKINDEHSGHMMIRNEKFVELCSRLKPEHIYYHCQSKFED